MGSARKGNLSNREHHDSQSFISYDATAAKYLSARTTGNTPSAITATTNDEMQSKRKSLGNNMAGYDMRSVTAGEGY